QKDYSKAKDCYEQIVLLAQQTGTRDMEMVALARLGSTNLKLGYKPQAIELYEQTLPIAKELGEYKREIAILIKLVFLYLEQQRYSKFFKSLIRLAFKHWLVIPIFIGVLFAFALIGIFYVILSVIIWGLVALFVSAIVTFVLWQFFQSIKNNQDKGE
ncbi:MAG: tetratricopeptide repeat protein, partial [Microcoleus sp.]